jgi:hypothetical protein
MLFYGMVILRVRLSIDRYPYQLYILPNMILWLHFISENSDYIYTDSFVLYPYSIFQVIPFMYLNPFLLFSSLFPDLRKVVWNDSFGKFYITYGLNKAFIFLIAIYYPPQRSREQDSWC